MSFKLPEDFVKHLEDKYNRAIQDGAIIFNGDSAVSQVKEETAGESKYRFHITLLDSLKHRPEKGTEEKNPFAKPEPELTILQDYGPSQEFRLVANKFPVVPYHFLLVTKDFVSQNTPLSPHELLGAFSVLRTLKSSSKDNWFAFYNSGPESGASQPHKHIQFMTLPAQFEPYANLLANTSEPFIPSEVKEPLTDQNLPFRHFLAKLPDTQDIDQEDLTMYFASLLQRTLTTLKYNNASHISYNFIMTTSYMLMIPRSSGTYKNTLGLNSCGYNCLLLCKNKEVQDLVIDDGVLQILAACGFPNETIEEATSYHY